MTQSHNVIYRFRFKRLLIPMSVVPTDDTVAAEQGNRFDYNQLFDIMMWSYLDSSDDNAMRTWVSHGIPLPSGQRRVKVFWLPMTRIHLFFVPPPNYRIFMMIFPWRILYSLHPDHFLRVGCMEAQLWHLLQQRIQSSVWISSARR